MGQRQVSLDSGRVQEADGGKGSFAILVLAITVAFLTASPARALTAPVLRSPADGATNQLLAPRLDWDAVTGALRYRVFLHTNRDTLALLSNTANTCSGCYVNVVETSEHTLPSGTLLGGRTYYWMVRAGSDTAGSPYSAIRSFTTLLEAPALLSPSNGAANQSLQPRLDWTAPSGAQRYRVFLDSDSNRLASLTNTDLCSSCLVTALVTPSEYTVPAGKLAAGRTYYWRVRAGSDAAGSLHSGIRSFTTAASTQPPPALFAVSPSSVAQGSGGFWLNIDGSGFSSSGAYGYLVHAGADVHLSGSVNGSALAEVVSSSRIRVHVTSVSNTAALGYRNVTVRYGPGSGDTVQRSNAFQVVAMPAPTVTLLAPHSGSFTVGNTLQIRWSSTNQHHAFVILVKDGREVATLHQQNPSASLAFDWRIPSIADGHAIGGGGYRIKVAVWNAAGVSAGATSTGTLTITAPKSPPEGLLPADRSEGLSFYGVTFQWRSANPSALLARVELTLREASDYNGTLGNWVGDCRDKNIGRAMSYSSESCGTLRPGRWHKLFIGFHFNDGSPPTGAGGFFKTRSGTASAFRFSSIPNVAVGQAASITLQAVDANGFIDASFSGEAALGALHSARVTPSSVFLRNGSWSGPVSLDAPSMNSALTATAWEGSRYLTGTSNPFQVLAQSPAPGKLVVEVRSSQGPLAGVPVTAGRTASDVAGRKTSGSDGQVVFENLPPARYLVWADSGPWGSGTEGKVEVAAGITSTLTLSLAGGRPPVILVPGIMGSTVVADDSLLYPILPEDRASREEIKIFDPIGEYWSVGPADLEVGFYALKRKLESQGYSVYMAPWDWRELADTAWKLYLKPVIDQARSETRHEKVDVVAHSMGGLVVRSYIQSDCAASQDCYDDDIRRFVMVGTPNSGSAAAYHMAEGADTAELDGGDGIFSDTLNAAYEQKHGTSASAVEKRLLKEFIDGTVPTVDQLLPVYTEAFTSDDPGVLIRIYSKINPFLSELNSSSYLSRMVPSDPLPNQVLTLSLLSNAYTDTLKSIEIGAPGNGIYPFGQPLQTTVGAGDSLVLSSLPRPDEELRDSFAIRRSSKGGHNSLILAFQSEIISFLEGNGAALSASSTSPVAEVTDQLRLSILGRVQPQVIAPDGSELGVDAVTGDLEEPGELSKVEAIPGSSGVALGEAADGVYTVGLQGLIQGNEVIWIRAGWLSSDDALGAVARALHHGTPLTFQIVVDSPSAEKVRIVSPVPAPTGITSSNVGGSTRLAWQAAAGVSGYNVYGRRQGEPAFVLLGTTAGTSFDTGHAFYQAGEGQIWRYVVLSTGSGGRESFFYEVVENRQPVIADFKADLRSGPPPLVVSFEDASTGPVTSWAWDFDGDGTVDSTERNPTFTYTAAGAYPVRLTVSGPPGEDSRTRPGYIDVGESTRELVSLSLTGPGAVDENGTGTFSASATFSDGSTLPVIPLWSEDSPFATIDASGLLSTSVVPGTQQVTITATYAAGGMTRSAVKTVSITERGIACSFRITSLDRPLPLAGGAGSLTVTTEPGCRWTAESGTGWISIQAPAGAAAGSGEVAYSAAVNQAGILRQGILTVAGREVPVWQRGAQVAAGLYHSLFLRRDGALFAWGAGGSGQLGNGAWTGRSLAGPVMDPEGDAPLTGVVAVAARSAHNLALREDGTVLAWGWNVGAQLGDGGTFDRNLPFPVRDAQGQPLTGVVAIAAGTSHSLALREDGSVVAWGNNYFGQLGDGTQETRLHPVPVTDVSGQPIRDVLAIGTGINHAFALRLDGGLLAWGADHAGQLGDGAEDHRRMRAAAVRTAGGGDLSGATQASGGGNHSLALSRGGSPLGWGDNPYGQVGDGTTTRRLYPAAVAGLAGSPLAGIASIAAGGDHGLAVSAGGSLFSWGRNDRGQLGDGSISDRSRPVQVLDAAGVPLAQVAAAAGGFEHSLALLRNGTLLAWGRNQAGQLGDGTSSDRSRALAVQGIPEPPGEQTDFHTLAPCRAVDTRSGAPLASGAQVTLQLAGVCGIPASAKAVSINVTAIGATAAGHVVLWPADVQKPGTSTLSFSAGQVRANNGILPLAGNGTGSLGASATLETPGRVHVLIDIFGYFQ